jgi:hypothetical protein
MAKPIWGMWARVQAMTAAIRKFNSFLTIVMTAGGIICLFYPTFWPGFVGIPGGVFIFLWELPVPGLPKMGAIYNTLYFRAIFYIGIAVPLMFSAPTTTGGLGIATSGVIYLVGAISGEKFLHPNDYGKRRRKKSGPKVVEAKPEPKHDYSRTLNPKRTPFDGAHLNQQAASGSGMQQVYQDRV